MYFMYQRRVSVFQSRRATGLKPFAESSDRDEADPVAVAVYAALQSHGSHELARVRADDDLVSVYGFDDAEVAEVLDSAFSALTGATAALESEVRGLRTPREIMDVLAQYAEARR